MTVEERNLQCDKCGICINKIKLFEKLSTEEQFQILKESRHQLFPKNTIIMCPEDKADKVIIVKKGKLKLCAYDENGKEYIYDIIGDGDILGEEAIFSEDNVGMYIETITDVNACILTRELLERFLASNSAFAIKLIRSLGKRVAEDKNKIRLLSISDAKKRLEYYLVLRCDQMGHNHIELTRDVIASAINASRETVSRKLSEIENEGNIQLIGYKKIHVLNKERLKSNSQ